MPFGWMIIFDIFLTKILRVDCFVFPLWYFAKLLRDF